MSVTSTEKTLPPYRRPITVRLDAALLSRASSLARLNDVSLRDLIECGLQSEVGKRLAEGGEECRAALDAVAAYRRWRRGGLL